MQVSQVVQTNLPFQRKARSKRRAFESGGSASGYGCSVQTEGKYKTYSGMEQLNLTSLICLRICRKEKDDKSVRQPKKRARSKPEIALSDAEFSKYNNRRGGALALR